MSFERQKQQLKKPEHGQALQLALLGWDTAAGSALHRLPLVALRDRSNSSNKQQQQQQQQQLPLPYVHRRAHLLMPGATMTTLAVAMMTMHQSQSARGAAARQRRGVESLLHSSTLLLCDSSDGHAHQAAAMLQHQHQCVPGHGSSAVGCGRASGTQAGGHSSGRSPALELQQQQHHHHPVRMSPLVRMVCVCCDRPHVHLHHPQQLLLLLPLLQAEEMTRPGAGHANAGAYRHSGRHRLATMAASLLLQLLLLLLLCKPTTPPA